MVKAKQYLTTWWQHALATLILLGVTYGLASWAIPTAHTIIWLAAAVSAYGAFVQFVKTVQAILKKL